MYKVKSVSRIQRRYVTVLVTATAVSGLWAAGSGFASSPGSGSGSGLLTGCYARATGNLRIVDHYPCRSAERPLSWNQTGPEGRQGLQGSPGTVGSTGPAGSPSVQGSMVGPTGPTGTQGSQGPSGPQGSAGASGPVGSQGLPGPQGLSGPQGPTDVYYRDEPLAQSMSQGSYATAVSLALPAGTYVVQAKVGLSASSGPHDGACFLRDATGADLDRAFVEIARFGTVMPLLATYGSSQAIGLSVVCVDAGGAGVIDQFARITAMRVTTVH